MVAKKSHRPDREGHFGRGVYNVQNPVARGKGANHPQNQIKRKGDASQPPSGKNGIIVDARGRKNPKDHTDEPR